MSTLLIIYFHIYLDFEGTTGIFCKANLDPLGNFFKGSSDQLGQAHSEVPPTRVALYLHLMIPR